MKFHVGAYTPGGDATAVLSLPAFAAALGASVHAAGAAAVSGTPNFTVPGNGQGAVGVTSYPHPN